jgi:creatinine amidohydrolase/Fe(II)-dependent formamide hydrolase-like protein
MSCLEFASLIATALNRMAERDGAIIIVVGVLEQHGPDTPVMIDSRLPAHAE